MADIWDESQYGYDTPGAANPTTDFFNEASYGYAPPPDPVSAPEGKFYGDKGGGVSTGGRTYAPPDQKATSPTVIRQAGTQYKPITGSTVSGTQTTKMIEGIPFPTMGAAPRFTAPQRSDERLYKLTQKLAAPQRRALDRATKLAMLRQHYDDPRGGENYRKILGGLGQGISNVYTGAYKDAFQMREAEFATQFAESMTNFKTQVASWQMKFKADLQRYVSNIGQQTTKTQRTDYTYKPGAAGSREEVGKQTKEIFGMGGYHSYSVPTVWG